MCRKCRYLLNVQKLEKIALEVELPRKKTRNAKLNYYSSDFEILPVKISMRISSDESYTVNNLIHDLRSKFKLSDKKTTKIFLVGKGQISKRVSK